MKDNWERVYERMDLSRETVERMVHAFMPSAAVASFAPAGGGFSNSNFQVRLRGGGEPMLLRVYRNADATCRKEAAIHRLVAERVRVPAFLHLDDRCEIIGRPFAFLEWIDGRPMNEAEDKREAAEAAGRALAAIHGFSFEKPGFLSEALQVTEPLAAGPEMLRAFAGDSLANGRAGQWLGEAEAERLRRFVEEHAEMLRVVEDDAVLVHSDFNVWNLLTTPEGRDVAAVIDWEFAFAASPLGDIGNMLRYERPGSGFEVDFIKGYTEAGGILPDEWRKLAKLLDLIALLDLLNRSEGGKNRITDLKELIHRTQEEM
ncbi:MAG TPA: aminoglycoside phosphotransferase family protein [Bacillales bacterium]|nr:aminoglycoside phosphotransferase family protein [Bacillales bacterium]